MLESNSINTQLLASVHLSKETTPLLKKNELLLMIIHIFKWLAIWCMPLSIVNQIVHLQLKVLSNMYPTLEQPIYKPWSVLCGTSKTP
jgi:hypothetical protein